MLKQDIARLVGWTLKGVAFFHAEIQFRSSVFDGITYYPFIAFFNSHIQRRSRLHGVNELMLRVYFQRKHLTFVARVTKYIRLFTLKNT